MAVMSVDDPSHYGVVVHDEPRPRHRLPGEAAARGGALAPLQLRHLCLRAAHLRLHPRRALRRLRPRCVPGAAGRRRALLRLAARRLLERCRQHRAVPPSATSTRLLGPRARARARPAVRSSRVSGWAPASVVDASVCIVPPVLIGDRCRVDAERQSPRSAHHRRRLRHRRGSGARWCDPLGRRQDGAPRARSSAASWGAA